MARALGWLMGNLVPKKTVLSGLLTAQSVPKGRARGQGGPSRRFFYVSSASGALPDPGEGRIEAQGSAATCSREGGGHVKTGLLSTVGFKPTWWERGLR